jgi:hypothetical protein
MLAFLGWCLDRPGKLYVSLDGLGVGLACLPQTSYNPPLPLFFLHCSLVGAVHCLGLHSLLLVYVFFCIV